MHSGAQRVLEQCRPGVLFNDLSACNDYQDALAAAAKVTVPATVILGSRDMMTPAKSGKALAAALPAGRVRCSRRRPHDDERAARRVARRAARVRPAQRLGRMDRPILGPMTPALLALTAI